MCRLHVFHVVGFLFACLMRDVFIHYVFSCDVFEAVESIVMFEYRK